MKNYLLPALRALFAFTILTGVIYPLAMTFCAQWIFPQNANGSMISTNGTVIGSELIAQKFSSDKYFSSRLSAIDFNPLPSGGSNFGPTSKALQDSVQANKKRFIEFNNLLPSSIVPKDMLFASGSGLDPHISPQAAMLQVARIAKARGFDEPQTDRLNALVLQYSDQPQFGIFGDPRVNVLQLNLALDNTFPPKK